MVRGIQFHMSTYLAAILAFCGLLTPSIAGVASPPRLQQLSQESQAPVTTTPEATQDSTPSAPPASPTQEPQKPSSETATKNATKTKAPAKKRRRRKTAASATTASPPKKIVRNGGTADPAVQLAPGMSAEQASSQRQNTTQLLDATDANLKQIASRPMNPTQQVSINQIRKYMEQAKAAEQAGDVERAENLASKARLLSDDLVKH
jgi:hypothetical protein